MLELSVTRNEPTHELPPTEVMYQELVTSNILTQESASQYQAQIIAEKQHVEALLASAGSDSALEQYEGWFLKYMPKVVSFGLTLQGLRGIYKSISFILVEYPQLEIALQQHQLTSSDINQISAKAIIMGISTLISMFFALRLAFLKTDIAKKASIIIGIILFLTTGALQDFFIELKSGETFSTYAVSFLESFFTWPARFFHQLW
jgi:hypothetical protein